MKKGLSSLELASIILGPIIGVLAITEVYRYALIRSGSLGLQGGEGYLVIAFHFINSFLFATVVSVIVTLKDRGVKRNTLYKTASALLEVLTVVGILLLCFDLFHFEYVFLARNPHLYILIGVLLVLAIIFSIRRYLEMSVANYNFLKMWSKPSWKEVLFSKKGRYRPFMDRKFFVLFSAAFIVQLAVTFFFSVGPSDLVKASVASEPLVVGKPSDRAADVYSVLSKLKKDFGITVSSQQEALERAKRRLKEAKKVKVVILDDFKKRETTVGFFGPIPVFATLTHGSAVEATIKSLMPKNIPVEYATEQVNTGNKYVLGFRLTSRLAELFRKIAKEKGFVIVNVSLGDSTKDAGTFLESLKKARNLIELNNKGVVLFQSAGNINSKSVKDLNLVKALGLLLENVYTTGSSVERYQYGEVLAKPWTNLRYRHHVKVVAYGTSFSSPRALVAYVKEVWKKVKGGE